MTLEQRVEALELVVQSYQRILEGILKKLGLSIPDEEEFATGVALGKELARRPERPRYRQVPPGWEGR